MRIREIAQTRVRYGYPRIRMLLNSEAGRSARILSIDCTRTKGWDCASVRQEVAPRQERLRPSGPNQVWALHFRAALELASAAEEIAAAYAGGILKSLDRAGVIATTRNQYVHAVAFIDFQTNTRMLQMRNGNAAPDEKQITDLAMESAWLARNFAEECEAS